MNFPGLFVKAWGYNGSVQGPTIKVSPNDKVCIRVINNLPETYMYHSHVNVMIQDNSRLLGGFII